MPSRRAPDSDDETAPLSATPAASALDATDVDPRPSKQQQRANTSQNGFPEPVDASSAIRILRTLVNHCNARTNGGPKWWRPVSDSFDSCLKVLEAQIEHGAVGQVDVSALTAQYASISASLAQVTSALGPASASASRPSRSIVPADQPRSFPLSIPLSLDAVPSNSPLYKVLPSQLKTTLDAAISKSNVLAATGSHVHSVKRDRTRLFVHTISLSQKEALVKFSDEWLPALGAGVRISVRKILLQADLVDTRFDPTADTALDVLANLNPTTIHSRDHLLAVSWVHGSAVVKSGRSSLSLTVTDIVSARALVREGLCVLGEHCPVNLQVPGVQQCFRCQGFNHTSTNCLKQKDPRPLTCGRCASAHATSDCACPATTKCTDMRLCSHITLLCANCRGPHKAFSGTCPVKTAALDAALRSPAYVALLNELLWPPPRK